MKKKQTDSNIDNLKLSERILRMIRRDWKTVPNMLSYFRLLLIPVFIVLYIHYKNYTAAAAIILLSGLTDVADGFIARKFNMVSDLGKALDPLADKLTQLAIFICLGERYRLIILFVCILAIKEIAMMLMGMLIMKRTGQVNSAKWYGKMTTFVTEATALILVFVPDISSIIADILILVSMTCVLFSFVMYLRRYIDILNSTDGKKEQK